MASRAASRAVCRRGGRRVGPVGDGKELSWQRVGRLSSSVIVGPVGLRLHDGGVFEPQAGAGDDRLANRGRPSIPDNWTGLDATMPTLTALVTGASSSGYLATLFLNLVESSPRAARLPFVVQATTAWCS